MWAVVRTAENTENADFQKKTPSAVDLEQFGPNLPVRVGFCQELHSPGCRAGRVALCGLGAASRHRAPRGTRGVCTGPPQGCADFPGICRYSPPLFFKIKCSLGECCRFETQRACPSPW